MPFNREFKDVNDDKFILDRLLENDGLETLYLVMLEMLKVTLKEDLENIIVRCKSIVDKTDELWYEHDTVQWFLDTSIFRFDLKEKSDVKYLGYRSKRDVISYKRLVDECDVKVYAIFVNINEENNIIRINKIGYSNIKDEPIRSCGMVI